MRLLDLLGAAVALADDVAEIIEADPAIARDRAMLAEMQRLEVIRARREEIIRTTAVASRDELDDALDRARARLRGERGSDPTG